MTVRLSEIEAALGDDAIGAGLEEILAGAEELDPSARGQLLNWVRELRDRYVEVAREVGDDEDRAMTLAVQYIELKSHWVLLNTRMNYRMANGGEFEPVAMYRAGLVSHLLGVLEPLFGEDELNRITRFLAQPLTSPGIDCS